MNIAATFFDGLRNVIARLGTDRDKASGSEYFYAPLTRTQIIGAYRSAWLPRKIVDIPAEDATRKWRTWNATKEQITAIEAVEQRFDIRAKVRRAMILARLTGGAAIYFGTTRGVMELYDMNAPRQLSNYPGFPECSCCRSTTRPKSAKPSLRSTRSRWT